MNFCSQCGARVILRIPDGDHFPRHVCDACGAIHYLNPKVVVGCIPEWQGRILLCKRAIEPRLGYWTLPAGFMEIGESARDGAARETLEEANAQVEVGELYSLFNLPHIGHLYLLYRARLLNENFSPGLESTAVELFAADDIPWQELAFAVVTETLKLYLRDRNRDHGTGAVRCGDIHRDPGSTSYRVSLYP